jgi:hypothetical protein
MTHIAGVLNLQARSRRNALHASRLLQARRAEQVEVARVVRLITAPAAEDHARGADLGPERALDG